MKSYTCTSCNTKYELDITDEQLHRINSGEMIQNVLPNMPADERELIISGYCGECFDSLFDEEDEETEDEEDDEDEDEDEFVKVLKHNWEGAQWEC